MTNRDSIMKQLISLLIFIIAFIPSALGQMYMGLNGLINIPSAEMYKSGDVQVGSYFLNKHMLPDPSSDGKNGFQYNGKPYNTADLFLSITPFKWIELSCTFTLLKSLADGYEQPKYNNKDRYISVKVNPLKEGKYWPAIAVGANDFLNSGFKMGSDSDVNDFFLNYFIVVTKHFDILKSGLGFNLSYRYCPRESNHKWNGVVGGFTWRPNSFRNLRAIVEWTGNEINIGADCLLWKHLFLQTALIDLKYFSGGVAYRVNLF